MNLREAGGGPWPCSLVDGMGSRSETSLKPVKPVRPSVKRRLRPTAIGKAAKALRLQVFMKKLAGGGGSVSGDPDGGPEPSESKEVMTDATANDQSCSDLQLIVPVGGAPTPAECKLTAGDQFLESYGYRRWSEVEERSGDDTAQENVDERRLVPRGVFDVNESAGGGREMAPGASAPTSGNENENFDAREARRERIDTSGEVSVATENVQNVTAGDGCDMDINELSQNDQDSIDETPILNDEDKRRFEYHALNKKLRDEIARCETDLLEEQRCANLKVEERVMDLQRKLMLITGTLNGEIRAVKADHELQQRLRQNAFLDKRHAFVESVRRNNDQIKKIEFEAERSQLPLQPIGFSSRCMSLGASVIAERAHAGLVRAKDAAVSKAKQTGARATSPFPALEPLRKPVEPARVIGGDVGAVAGPSVGEARPLFVSEPGGSNVGSGKPSHIFLADTTKSIPPIITHDVDSRKISMAMKSAGQDCTIRQINNNMTQIKCTSVTSYNHVASLLANASEKFYTYTPREERPKTYVIRGLSNQHAPQEIQRELETMHRSVKIMSLNRMNTRFSTTRGVASNLFTVQVTSGTLAKDISSIKLIFNYVVSITPFKQTGVPQCKRCQRFGHISLNCNLEWRCVKCGRSHGIGSCQVPSGSENGPEGLSCANCGGPHVASFRGCPKRVAYAAKKSIPMSTASGAKRNDIQKTAKHQSEIKAGLAKCDGDAKTLNKSTRNVKIADKSRTATEATTPWKVVVGKRNKARPLKENSNNVRRDAERHWSGQRPSSNGRGPP